MFSTGAIEIFAWRPGSIYAVAAWSHATAVQVVSRREKSASSRCFTGNRDAPMPFKLSDDGADPVAGVRS